MQLNSQSINKYKYKLQSQLLESQLQLWTWLIYCQFFKWTCLCSVKLTLMHDGSAQWYSTSYTQRTRYHLLPLLQSWLLATRCVIWDDSFNGRYWCLSLVEIWYCKLDSWMPKIKFLFYWLRKFSCEIICDNNFVPAGLVLSTNKNQ